MICWQRLSLSLPYFARLRLRQGLRSKKSRKVPWNLKSLCKIGCYYSSNFTRFVPFSLIGASSEPSKSWLVRHRDVWTVAQQVQRKTILRGFGKFFDSNPQHTKVRSFFLTLTIVLLTYVRYFPWLFLSKVIFHENAASMIHQRH